MACEAPKALMPPISGKTKEDAVTVKDIEAKIGGYWDEQAEGFAQEHDTEDIEAWREAVCGCLGARGPSTVLDLGTGTGFLANLAASLGHFCVGLDISEKMLNLAVKNSEAKGAKAVYLKGSVMDLPFAEESLDFIISARLLWTLVEPLETIRHWARFVRPGGKIACFNRFKDGLGMCGGKDVYGQRDVDGAVTLAHAKSPAELLRLIGDAGLMDAELRHLPNLTKAQFREGNDEWHALMGTKPARG